MRAILVVLSCFLLVGCLRGPAKPDKPEKIDEGEEISKNPFKALDQFGKIADKMAAIQKEIAEMKPVDPVSFEKLLPLLPKPPAGYKTDDKPRGETTEFGEFKHSFVEQTYRKDDMTLTVKIHDAAQISALYASFSIAAMLNRTTTEGHEKGVTIDGNPGIDKYSKANQRAELTVMVGKRFLVDIHADGVSPDFARTVYSSIDLKALMALK